MYAHPTVNAFLPASSLLSSLPRSVARPLAVVPAAAVLGLIAGTVYAAGIPTGEGQPGEATGFDVVLLLLYVGVALLVSFLCSILEAALLSTREGSLQERTKAGEKGAMRLLRLKRERLDDSISAILILNTVAHTAGVAGAGLQAGIVFAGQPVVLGLFPVVLTILILVLTEIVPKTLGAVHASRLVPWVGLVLSFLVWTMKPFLVMTRAITGALAHSEGPSISRGELAAMVSMAAREGILRPGDSRVVSNVLRYDEIRVEDVMTPRTVVAMADASLTRRELADDDRCRGFSRIPIHDGDPDRVIGYVLQREVLSALARGGDPRTPLLEHRRDVIFFPETLTVDRALRRLTEGREHLAMVSDEFGGLAGMVTMEDLLETILGVEIVDEMDHVVDMREEAVKLREKRLQELGIVLGESGIPGEKAPGEGGDDGPR